MWVKLAAYRVNHSAHAADFAIEVMVVVVAAIAKAAISNINNKKAT
jgi:hypothetical protein